MNQIKATISKIEQHEGVCAVYFDALNLSMVSLKLNPVLDVGTDVMLSVKATNISLSKKVHDNISISNQLECIVDSIENGTILACVNMKIKDFNLQSIISYKSVLKMDIKVGDKIIALIKASDLAILEIL